VNTHLDSSTESSANKDSETKQILFSMFWQKKLTNSKEGSKFLAFLVGSNAFLRINLINLKCMCVCDRLVTNQQTIINQEKKKRY